MLCKISSVLELDHSKVNMIGSIPIVFIHSGMVFNGNIAAFQAEVTGSSPVTRFWSYSEVAYHASLSKMYHEFESR